jgi:uncharacterized membrane protein YeaQ/YmgE (transglycosylase-associated protein family)
MQFIIWIIVGGVAGWIASMIMDTNRQMGILSNIIVGMVGALIGGLVVTLLTTGNADLTTAFTNFSFTSLIVSILGAVILLTILRMFRGSPRRV